MKSQLMNSKQINRWAYNKMRTINKHIKQWAQSGPLPMNQNAVVPKWVYSSNRNKLHTMFNTYKKHPDQYFMKYDKSGRTREPMIDLESKIQDKIKLANLRHNMKLHPNTMAYKEDLQFKNGMQVSKERFTNYSHRFEPTTSLIPAKTVQKDLKKFNKLDSTDTSDFLAQHPKFSIAVNAFSAQTVYKSYKRNGISTKLLDNMNEVYNGTGLKHGKLDDAIAPGELQARAVKYIRQKQQINRGQQFSHALTQSASVFIAHIKEPRMPSSHWLRQAPDLQAKLDVVPGDSITHDSKDNNKIYDNYSKRPIPDKNFYKMNYNYMVRGTAQMAHTLKEKQNPLSTNAVLKQAMQITKAPSQENKRIKRAKYGLQMDNLQLKIKGITASDKEFFTKDRDENLKKLHQGSKNNVSLNKSALNKFSSINKSAKKRDNTFNQHNSQKPRPKSAHITGPKQHRSIQHGPNFS